MDLVTFDKARLKMEEKSWTCLLNLDDACLSSVIGKTFFLFLLYGEASKVSCIGPDLWRRLDEDLVDGELVIVRSTADFMDLFDRR